MAYLKNQKLLEQTEARIKQLFGMPACRENREAGAEQVLRF